LSIIPFEPEWYARRTPNLRVEFVGHPMVDRFKERVPRVETPGSPRILLLPGSRPGEIRRHLPVVLGAWELIRQKLPSARAKIVLPNDSLVSQVKPEAARAGLDIQIGNLPDALAG